MNINAGYNKACGDVFTIDKIALGKNSKDKRSNNLGSLLIRSCPDKVYYCRKKLLSKIIWIVVWCRNFLVLTRKDKNIGKWNLNFLVCNKMIVSLTCVTACIRGRGGLTTTGVSSGSWTLWIVVLIIYASTCVMYICVNICYICVIIL